MQIKIGQIYKVKPEFRNMCDAFNRNKKATYVRFLLEETYTFLDKDKQVLLNNICNCYGAEHLEPLEKTLYNLEIGDEVEDYVGRRKIIGLIESSSENPVYIVSDYSDYKIARGLFTAKGMSRDNYKVVQSEPTEEIKVEITTVSEMKIPKSEAEKFLGAHFSFKVKIVD